MSAARDVSPCQRLDRWVTAYVDDELDAIHALEVEDHLEACELCHERVALLKATRCSLRGMSVKCPLALRQRISQVLVDARRDEVREQAAVASELLGIELEGSELEQGELEQDGARLSQMDITAAAVLDVQPSGTASDGKASNDTASLASPGRAGGGDSSLFKLRHIMPLAAAATVLLVFGVMRLQEHDQIQDQSGRYQASANASLDYLLEEMVAQHAHPPPPETTDPEGLAKFDPYLGLRVRKPKLDAKHMRYIGARMMPRRHAMLQYMLRERHRVSLYVFDSKRVPLHGKRLKARHIGARNVYVGNMRGYSVAASEHNGVGYVVTSDLPNDESAKLVLTASR